MLRGIRQKIRRGELSAKAPIRYFNEPRLRTIEPDKKTFRKVKECLEAFATGNYTLSQIRDKMFSLGLVGARSGKKMSLSSVEHILKNPFYYGHFFYRGELHQGSHKPMISKKLFDKIQQVLKDKGKPRKKPKQKNFKFLGFAKCGECGYAITTEKQVKKSGLEFVYYHCTHKSKTQKCSQRSFLREEKLAEQIKEQCQKVSLPDLWRDRFLDKLKEWRNENRQTSDLFAQNLKKKIEELKTKISRLTDAYLAGAFELAEFQQKKNALTSEKKTLEEKLSDFERKGNHWLELTRNWVLEANQAKNLALQENFSEMKNFLKKIGLNRQISQQKLSIDFKKPFNFLAKLPAEARAEGEDEAANQLWWTVGDSNPRPQRCERRALPAELTAHEKSVIKFTILSSFFLQAGQNFPFLVSGIFNTRCNQVSEPPAYQPGDHRITL